MSADSSISPPPADAVVVPTASRRRELGLCLGLATAAAAARGLLFMQPGVRFDPDQAIVGLMAKHISEGVAFPVHFYGQSYLLALEAYLAAPVMWWLGPTEVALKLPVLLLNVAIVGLLVSIAHRDLGLRPSLALAGALPLVVPPLLVGTRIMEAMGGNVEPLLYTLLLWRLRERLWAFAAVLAIGVVHRELTVYAGAALLVLDVTASRRGARAIVSRWAVAAVLVVVAASVVDALRPFAAMYGPGSVARATREDISVADAVGAQICIVPSRWPSRGRLVLTEHLPLLVGGLPGPNWPLGINSGMGNGNPGLGPWVLALTIVALAAGVTARRRRPAAAPAGIPAAAFAWYLVLTGGLSIAAYWLVACSQVTTFSAHYDLLAIYVPVGALLGGLGLKRPTVRAGLDTATLLWAVLSFDDYRALAGEVADGRWPNPRGAAARALAAAGDRALWGEFRLAYVVTFLAAERVTVASTSFHRVDRYAERARAANAPILTYGPCRPEQRSEAVAPGIVICGP
ncbi:MAG: hypothetical protein AB7R67_13980 [Vicinamibacterales bacterium]